MNDWIGLNSSRMADGSGARTVYWQLEGYWFDPRLRRPSVEVSMSKTAGCCLAWLTPPSVYGYVCINGCT